MLEPARVVLGPEPVVPGLVARPLDPVAHVQSRASLAHGLAWQRRDVL